MGWWLLRLSAKILALLRLSGNFFSVTVNKKGKKLISFVSKSSILKKLIFFYLQKKNKGLRIISG